MNDKKEVFLKIGDKKFYKIGNGYATSVNIETMTIKQLMTTPSYNVKEVCIISKEDYKAAEYKVYDSIY